MGSFLPHLQSLPFPHCILPLSSSFLRYRSLLFGKGYGGEREEKNPSFDHPVLSSSFSWQNLVTSPSSLWWSFLFLTLIPISRPLSKPVPFKAKPVCSLFSDLFILTGQGPAGWASAPFPVVDFSVWTSPRIHSWPSALLSACFSPQKAHLFPLLQLTPVCWWLELLFSVLTSYQSGLPESN